VPRVCPLMIRFEQEVGFEVRQPSKAGMRICHVRRAAGDKSQLRPVLSLSLQKPEGFRSKIK
jgi:ribosomal protein L34